jgi:hypothetical protein
VCVCGRGVQVFEGMGLGALLTTLPSDKTTKKVVMICLYTLVTPIGFAIGIGIHETFNPSDPAGLVARGAFGALSAGILFYNCYTELFAEEVHAVFAYMLQCVWFDCLCVYAFATIVRCCTCACALGRHCGLPWWCCACCAGFAFDRATQGANKSQGSILQHDLPGCHRHVRHWRV